MSKREPMPGGEYLWDRYGVVWRVVRDGGMVTTADQMGVISAGIAWLEKYRGPTARLQPPARADHDTRNPATDEEPA